MYICKYIHQLVGFIWQKKVVSKEWRTTLVYPFNKKRDRQLCNIYRGIVLLKVHTKFCLLDRIKLWSEEILEYYQADFWQNRFTIDQIFILQQLLQKMWKYDKSVHMLLIDFNKAYYSIHRQSLVNVLKEFEMPQNLISLINISIEP